MNKVAHILKPNAARKLPKWVVFFDTETKEIPAPGQAKELVLRLGYAILTRRSRDNSFNTVSEATFYTPEDFTRWLGEILEGKERYYLVAHNVSFDVRVVRLFEYLHAEGWDRKLFIDEGINFIAKFRKAQTTLQILNNQQFFNTSLKTLGESIGTYKGQVDFKDVQDPELLEYCKQDVEVLRSAFNVWIKFISDNNLGNFQITAASQAMSAFRHRFMDHKIYIHNDERTINLERESYHGGRVECFYIGKWDKGQIYSLDVNSMYPYVMQQFPVPVKLLKFYKQASVDIFQNIRHKFGYIAEAEVTVTGPCLPVVLNNRLTFPVGSYRGVFAKPELELALRKGILKSISRLAVYEERVIFRPFVEFFYNSRLNFKSQGNTAFAYVSKILMNSLYGKFGQRQLEYRKIGTTRTIPDGYYNIVNFNGQGHAKLRVIQGVVERADSIKEGYNSFVAVASFVTSEARRYLYDLMEIAGLHNIIYCDTDSLFVNQEGYERLKEYIDNTRLGLLKVVGIQSSAAFWAPKLYTFGDKTVRKGIRANAVTTPEGSFIQDKFVSFKGALRTYRRNGVFLERVTKRLNPIYHKGNVMPDGSVQPFVLEFPEV